MKRIFIRLAKGWLCRHFLIFKYSSQTLMQTLLKQKQFPLFVLPSTFLLSRYLHSAKQKNVNVNQQQNIIRSNNCPRICNYINNIFWFVINTEFRTGPKRNLYFFLQCEDTIHDLKSEAKETDLKSLLVFSHCCLYLQYFFQSEISFRMGITETSERNIRPKIQWNIEL